MQKDQIEVRKKYAIREPVASGVDLQQVRVLEHVRGTRWKVEWIVPNPGLVDYVTSKNIVCRWSERRAFLRDERNEEALQRSVGNSSFPGEEHPLERAASITLDAAGERPFDLWRGVLHFDEREALERVAARAGIPVPEHPTGTRIGADTTTYRGNALSNSPRRSRVPSRERCSTSSRRMNGHGLRKRMSQAAMDTAAS